MSPLSGRIPKIELWTCVFLWSSAVCYSIYCFSVVSFKHYRNVTLDEETGWLFAKSVIMPGNIKDIADVEWEFSKQEFSKMYGYVAALFIVSEILRKYNYTTLLSLSRILIGSLFILNNIGWISLLLLSFQPLLYIIVTPKRNLLLPCFFSYALLIGIIKHTFLATLSTEVEFVNIFYTLSIVYWGYLRCYSYKFQTYQGAPKDILGFLAYYFYLPLLISGPLVSYADFKISYKYKGNLFKRVITLICSLSRCIFWGALLDLFLHFCFVNVVTLDPAFAESLKEWSFYGFGWSMAITFHLKYVIIYGIPCALSIFEDIPAPPRPHCVSRTFFYSDMWRYFDVGIYKFISNCIYIPCVKATQSRFLSSFISFAFVYLWHGLHYHILLWSTLNFISVSIEALFKDLNKRYFEPSMIYERVNLSWTRRFVCLIASPLMAISVISNFYLLSNYETGTLFMDRFIFGDITTNVVVLIFLYCCGQFSIELRNNLQKKEKIKI